MEGNFTKGRAVRGMVKTICFAAFGACIFANPLDFYNPYRIGFGVLVCLLFGWLLQKFLQAFLSLFNGKVKKEKGKEAIAYAVETGMLYLVPFATMACLATYVLQWSLIGAFISTGIISVGTAASIEMGRITGKPAIKNTLITSGVSYAFSLLLTFSIPILIKAPGLVEGLVKLVPTLFKGGGAA